MWTTPSEIGRTLIAGALPDLMHFLPPADEPALARSLGRIGSLEVRLATRKKDVRRAQRLRYKVFYREGVAHADPRMILTRRDADRFDRFCDHLIVVDHAAINRRGAVKPKVVGAYRLLRGEVAGRIGGFYSSAEFDIAPLLARHRGKRILELGRSCVLKPYRGKRTIELLWRGLHAYIRYHRIDVMIGCASFEGANPLRHAEALSLLAHHARADGEWAVRAHPDRHIGMAAIAKDAIDTRRAMGALPPLIKGYLRLGAKFGDGAVVDRKFNTTDVFVVLPVAAIAARYLDYFGAEPALARAG